MFNNIIDKIHKAGARVDVYDAGREFSYRVKRHGLAFGIRKVVDVVGFVFEGSAETLSTIITGTVGNFLQFFVGAEIARNLGLFAGAIGGKIAGIVGVSLAGALSAGFAQMDYVHQKDNLRNLYLDELAAALGKPARQVTIRDMETLAEKNPVLDEELRRAKRQRNFAVPLAIAATLASFAAVTVALPAVLAAMQVPALGFAAGFAMKTLVSITAYCAVKFPLRALGRKIFGLYDETVNDRIVGIKREHDKGHAISPEQVLSVFAKANHELEAVIVKEFGKPYDALSCEEKDRALYDISAILPVEAVADAINSGALKATELAFTAVGQHSGVILKETPAAQAAPVLAVAEEKTVSFQEKLAKSGHDPKANHAERVTLQAGAEAIIGFS